MSLSSVNFIDNKLVIRPKRAKPGSKKLGKYTWPWKASRYRIVINTNKTYLKQNELDQAQELMKNLTLRLKDKSFWQRNNLIIFLKEGGLLGELANDETKYDKIVSFQITASLQNDGLAAYLHEHLDIQINHNWWIKLNTTNLRKLFQDLLGLNSLFLRSKKVKGDMTAAYLIRPRDI